MVRRRNSTDDQLQDISERKTKIPVADIRKLIKLQSDLNTFVKRLMENHGVSTGYIRGLMKEPTGVVAKKSKLPVKKKPTKQTTDKKKPITKPAKKTTTKKTTTNKTKKTKKTLDELLGF